MAGEKMERTLEVAVIFMETLERLGIDYSLHGFDDRVHAFKDFSPNSSSPTPPTLEEKNKIVGTIREARGGGTSDTEAVDMMINGDEREGVSGLKHQAGERRVLIVMTDGEGNGAASNKMNEVLAAAEREGITVIGVGVGEGMAYVEKRYKRHVLEPTLETAPEAIGAILEEEVQRGFEQPDE